MRFNAHGRSRRDDGGCRSSGSRSSPGWPDSSGLRDFGVPEADLDDLGATAAGAPGAQANPRPVSAAEAAELFRSVWYG
jgi:hypothetical protein